MKNTAPFMAALDKKNPTAVPPLARILAPLTVFVDQEDDANNSEENEAEHDRLCRENLEHGCIVIYIYIDVCLENIQLFMSFVIIL